MPLSGVGRMLLASMFLSLMAAMVKYVSARVPTFEIILLRCVLPIPILVLLLRKRRMPLLASNVRLILVRGAFGVTAMGLYFFALGHLPIADALLLGRFQPVFVVLLAAFFLDERPGLVTVLCVGASIVGVVLILQPTLAVGNVAGVAVILSAAASAIAHTTLRRLSIDDDPTVIVLNFTALAALVAAPLSVQGFVWPRPCDMVTMAGIASCATAGQLLMTSAYAIEEAPVVAAAGYATAVFGVAWGFVFWREVPAPLVWLGGGLVVSAGVALFWSRRHQPARAWSEG